MSIGYTYYYWAPRVLGILSILFVSIFALDAFDPELSLRAQILGFLIHLIPSFILALLLAIAWKWERIGGIIFTLIGCAFTPIIFLHNYRMNDSVGMSLIIILTITVPFILVGVLFLLSHHQKNKEHAL